MSIPNDPERYAEETVGAAVKIVCKEMDIEQPSKNQGEVEWPRCLPQGNKARGRFDFLKVSQNIRFVSCNI